MHRVEYELPNSFSVEALYKLGISLIKTGFNGVKIAMVTMLLLVHTKLSTASVQESIATVLIL